MKQNIYLLIVLMAMTGMVSSCKKDPKLGSDGELPHGSVEIPLKDAQVVLPTGSGYDLTGAELLILGQPVPVGKDGHTKVADIKGRSPVNLSFLFDKNDKPVLIGVVTAEGEADISTRSTAKALLYYALGLPFQTDTLTILFFDRGEELNGVPEWIAAFEEIWKNDPLTLSTGTFLEPLRKATHQVLPGDRGMRLEKMAAKASDLKLDANDIRSGLQILEDGLGQLSVNNNYRRRAHAFLYKMKYLDDDSVEHIVLPNIGNATKADMDLAIDPIGAINSAMGEIGKWVEDELGGTESGVESFLKKSGPVILNLADNEAEATYKVRIVGPGRDAGGSQLITETELSKLTRLEIETFLIDFVIPAVTAGTAAISLVDDVGMGKSGYEIGTVPENVIKAGELFLSAAPDIYEEIKKGDYMMALRKSLEHFAGAVVKDEAKMLLDVCLHMAISHVANVNAGNLTEMVGRSMGRILNSIAVIDLILQGNDLRLVATHAATSRNLEEWTVVARGSKVSLSPEEAKVVPYSQQKITAEIKNMEESGDTHPYFEWSTSGKWGYLKDTKGHQGASFESSDHEVFYNANTNSGLTDGDNWEYIYVKAYMGSRLIGTDTTRINVRRSAYELKPNGVTLTGRKSGSSKFANANDVALRIEPINANIPGIAPNDQREYQVVWTTSGKHGGMYGKENITPASTITNYDDNEIWYECIDDQTLKGTETVIARIYSRDKGATNEPFRLFDEVKATVNIDNDPKKRIIRLQPLVLKGDTLVGSYRDSYGNSYTSHQCFHCWGTRYTQQPEDESYELRVIDYYNNTFRWKAGEPAPSSGFGYGDLAVPYDGSMYTVGWGGTWSVGPLYPDQERKPCNWDYSNFGGTIEMIVTLK